LFTCNCIGFSTDYTPFPPGHSYCSIDSVLTRWYNPTWTSYDNVIAKALPPDPKIINDALTECVRGQLMTDVPYGVLLSGGLDSSIISAIAKKFAV
jgi:asparagine synthase (glutamine-hydrolysing)